MTEKKLEKDVVLKLNEDQQEFLNLFSTLIDLDSLVGNQKAALHDAFVMINEKLIKDSKIPNIYKSFVEDNHYNDTKKYTADPLTFILIPALKFDFLTGNILKYLWRAERKNGLSDIEKAKVYYNIWKTNVFNNMRERGIDFRAYSKEDKKKLGKDVLNISYRITKNTRVDAILCLFWSMNVESLDGDFLSND